MPSDMQLSRNDIDRYLNILAKEYKKRNRKAGHVELILVGGASVIINYGFREMTADIDAMILADSMMKEAIYAVAEMENLPDDWLNADFEKSGSYSDKLVQYSEYYRTFANIVEVRTVKDEYLAAMKLVAGRNYKRDLSDIAGIIITCRKEGRSISYEVIDHAMTELYGSWDRVDAGTISFLRRILALEKDEMEDIFRDIMAEENKYREIRLQDLKTF